MKIKEYKSCAFQKCKSDEAICKDTYVYNMVQAEKERSVESLISHLSEQRHDFFNLLQVLYGYTQLKKPEKVLVHISDYCRQMKNIGRLYNCKCIKLADLIYNKCKEAESADLKLEVSVKVNFEPVAAVLDDEEVLYVLDHAISGYIYILYKNGCRNVHIMYDLKEDANNFHMEIYCREHREGQLEPINFIVPLQATYWKKIERNVMCFESITKYCTDNGFDGRMLENGSVFVLNICKTQKGE